MNSDQDKEPGKLEAELRSFRPAPLSAELKDRILRSIAANKDPDVIWFSWPKLTFAAAAVLLIAVGLHFIQRPKSAPAEVVNAPAVPADTRQVIMSPKVTIYKSAPQRILKPVSYHTTLVAQREVGPTTNSPAGPSHTMHCKYMDQYEWCDEEHDAVYTTRKPRDSFVVVPVSSY